MLYFSMRISAYFTLRPAAYCFGWVLALGFFVGLQARETEGPAHVAVMTAYSVETDVMLEELGLGGLDQAEPTRTIKGIRFYETEYAGVPLVLFETGMSPTNAAMSLQIALYEYHIESVLFAGVAGSLTPDFEMGDVVVAEQWRHHTEAAYFNPKEDGDGYHVASYFDVKYPNFGMIFPDDPYVIRAGMAKPEKQASFSMDPELLALAREAIAGMPELKVGNRSARLHVGGLGTTGPVFVDNAKYREFLHNTFGALITEMETAAYAQVCWVNEVPFLAVRGVSDLAGGQKGLNHEDAYAPLAGKHAIEVTKAILRAMGKNQAPN